MTTSAPDGALVPGGALVPDGKAAGGWPRWRTALRVQLGKLLQQESRVFLALSVVIGALTGLAVVAFILVSERFGMRLYPVGGAPWRGLLFPVVGSLGAGILLFKFFPDARGSGVPQTKAALFARGGTITLRTVLGKFLCTSLTLASGIPLGREGPSVQVGAGIGSVLGRSLGLKPEQVKRLIPVGAAAAIAAAFNTPLAAVVFALEEIMGDMHAPVMGAVVLASATAWMVLRVSLGNHPLFHVPQYQLVSSAEFGVYAVLGVVGGIVSAIFTRTLLSMRAAFLRLPRSTAWAHPVVGGLLVGVMGWFIPQVLGVGYGFVGQALNGSMAVKVMVLLVVLKLLAVTTSYASGNAGGIFGPALFLGAMVGASLGAGAHYLFPAYTATPGAYALVGMGCLFAGIVRAPMTSVLMIFEMTQDYAVIVPLMIANMISLYIATRLQHEPIYEALAEQDGIHLPAAGRQRSGQMQVAYLTQPAGESLDSESTVASASSALVASDARCALVTGPEGVIGVVNRSFLERQPADKCLRDVINPLDFAHVHPDHGIDLALERMGKHNFDLLPVVNRANIRKLEGVITLQRVLEAYGVSSARSV